MANNLRGLTEEEAERAASQAIVTRYGVTPETVTDVLQAKKELLRRSGMLEFIDASETWTSVGGLDNLKRWLAQRRGTWEDAARDFGLEPPRGAIILGVQGCGKSMCARAIAGEWKLPLVKFDTAAIFDKYIGETEKRIQKVFRVAEGLGALRILDRRTGKSLCRKRAGFGVGGCRSFVAHPGRLPFLDAGSQSSGIRGRHLQQRDGSAAGADP